MPVRVRGTLVVDLASGELESARRAVVKAVASGALGRASSVSLDGEAIAFVGGGGRGRIVLHADGRASYELRRRPSWAEVAWAVGAATLASVTATLALGWIPYWALTAGFLGGASAALGSRLRARRRADRDVRSLLGKLRLLLDSRSE